MHQYGGQAFLQPTYDLPKITGLNIIEDNSTVVVHFSPKEVQAGEIQKLPVCGYLRGNGSRTQKGHRWFIHGEGGRDLARIVLMGCASEIDGSVED